MTSTGFAADNTRGETYDDAGAVRSSVQDFYSGVTGPNQSVDLKTNACKCSEKPSATIRDALKLVPTVIKNKFYGCGNPIPDGIAGRTVLDLGCGTGRDCYIASIFAGAAGRVVGIDMTPSQLVVARDEAPAFLAANPTAAPMTYLEGVIEDIAGAGVAAGSVDVVISNCVVNLSPDKPAVLKGVYDCLNDGGEFYFSDVYCDRRLPDEIRRHEMLFGECIGGALYVNDFLALCRRVGFGDPRELTRSTLLIEDDTLQKIVGDDVKFYSTTYRLFKLPAGMAEPDAEDYHQTATYKGTVPGAATAYALDECNKFEAGVATAVSGNSAAILQHSWLAAHFDVAGSRDAHYGAFQPQSACCGGDAGGGGCCEEEDAGCCDDGEPSSCCN
jgi:SAM-dependent methyltransferase